MTWWQVVGLLELLAQVALVAFLALAYQLELLGLYGKS